MLAPRGEQGRDELFSESEGHGRCEEPFVALRAGFGSTAVKNSPV